MDAKEFMKSVSEANDFRMRAMSITGNDIELLDASDEDIKRRLSVAQYAVDVLINVAEERGLIGMHDGHPTIPYELPDGVEPVETILTRQFGPTR